MPKKAGGQDTCSVSDKYRKQGLVDAFSNLSVKVTGEAGSGMRSINKTNSSHTAL